MSKKNKFFNEQKVQIINEDERIILIKASTGDYDRDDDRIDPTQWKLSEYGVPFIDAHKSSGSMDNRLGEVKSAYHKDGTWYNEVKLDKPTGDPQEWTDGEKLANRLWKMVKNGDDIRVSVGFFADVDKAKVNAKGGIDFAGQEQYELSAVLVPANPKAGIKSKSFVVGEKELSLEEIIETYYEDVKTIVEEKAINREDVPQEEIPLGKQLSDLVKELNQGMYSYIVSVYPKKVVANVYGSTGGAYIDIFLEYQYEVDENGKASIVSEGIEVEPMDIWITKKFEDMTNVVNKLYEGLEKNNKILKGLTKEKTKKSIFTKKETDGKIEKKKIFTGGKDE